MASEEPKKPVAPKSRKTPTHPSYEEMIKDAIVTLKDKTGSSQYAIAKFLEEKHKQLPSNFRKFLLYHLKRLVASSKLDKVKASFKLPPVKYSALKPSSVAAAKKSIAAKSKSKPKPKPTPKARGTKSKTTKSTTTKAPATAKAKPAAKPKPKERPVKASRTSTRTYPKKKAPGPKLGPKKVAPEKKAPAKSVKPKARSVSSPVKKATTKKGRK